MPAIDDSMDFYDESTESVVDDLLRMFDDGNDSVETKFNTVENRPIENFTKFGPSSPYVRIPEVDRRNFQKNRGNRA